MTSISLYEPLVYDKASEILKSLRFEINTHKEDEDLQELYRDFLESCINYANMRAEWSLMSKEKKMEKDSFRTSLHDSVLMNLTILKRYMTNNQMSTEWYANLVSDPDADIKTQPYRKLAGDFACHVANILGIEAR